jgi:hypothetical protein
MKKFLAILLFAVVACFGAAPAVSSGVNYENLGAVSALSKGAAWDTLVATDSAVVIAKVTPADGAEMVLVRGAITGGGSDSVSVKVVVDHMGADNALMFRSVVDTLSSADGEAISLAVSPAAWYRVKLIGYGANGGQVILNRFQLFQRRVLTWTKAWQ